MTTATLDADPGGSTCPICGKPSAGGRLRPFCTARCADIDLGRWLTGQYRVAGAPAEDEPEEPSSGGAPAGAA